MPRRLYSCTPTRLSTWLDCPRRYRMTYLDRPAPPKGPPWAHNSLGASVHNALAGWWRLPRRQRDPAAAGRLLTDGWITEGYADQAQSDACLHWAREIVERYTAGLDPAAEPAGVERTVATRTEVIALSGRIDRLDRRPAGPGAGPGHRTGGGRLQDRAAPADHRRRPQLTGPGAVRAGRGPGAAAALLPGGAAPGHAGHGDRLDAHAGVAAAAPVPGRGHRRGVRRGGRELPGRPGRARPGVPAADRAGLRLV